MKTIQIKTESNEYPVYIGSGISQQLPQLLADNCKSISKILVITDEKVASLYLNNILTILKDFHVDSFIVPASEKAKSFEYYYECQTYALSKGLDRSSLILALGGGVVGDLAGFVAATFLRGIPFIQIPTTLLAHDSAVGGKVAINHELGKNMIGAFHQPNAVVYDTDFLKTLPTRELRSGFAEVIKHSLIADLPFFEWLQKEVSSLDDLQDEKLQYAILKGIGIKAAIVSQDEQEKGIRAYLNFGHTLGHAIEAELGYGKITHGEGVAIGMIFALKVSEHLFNTPILSNTLAKWFELFGFPTSVSSQIEPGKLLERMKRDKKSSQGTIRMVLLKEIGHVDVYEVEDELVLQLLKKIYN